MMGLVWLHLLAAGLPPNDAIPGGVQVTLTTADQTSILEKRPDLPPLSANVLDAKEQTTITVHPSLQFQTIIGFGAALTDASAYVLSHAPHHVQEYVLRKLFGPTAEGGIRLNMLRLTIGVSDFSTSYEPGSITYDDVTGDFNLEHFSIGRDEAFLLPMLRRILAINPDIIIMASPWTAPLWLKTERTLGGGYLRDDARVFATYAQYLVRYLEEYERKGIRVHYLTLQNEPGHGDCSPMPCMKMSPDQQIYLAKELGSRLRASSSNVSAVKLLAYDHNWGPNDQTPKVRKRKGLRFVMLFAPVTIVGVVFGMVMCCFVYARGMFPGRWFGDLPGDSERIDSHIIASFGSWWGVKALFATWLTALIWTLFYMPHAASSYYMATDSSKTFVGIDWPAAVLSSQVGHEFVGVAWHCYGAEPSAQAMLQANLSSRDKSIEHHMTECTGGDWSGEFDSSFFWNQHNLFIDNFHNYGQSTVYWNLVLDEQHGPKCTGGACCEDCRGVVTVPSSSKVKDVSFNPEFACLGHHSPFLGPGAQRISSAVSHEMDVHAIAYRNTDGSLVLVAVNDGADTRRIRVKTHDDSDGHDSVHSFDYSLPRGAATFKWDLPGLVF